VYYRPWVDPWKVLGWGLEVAGLKNRAVEDGKIREGKVVVLRNVEVWAFFYLLTGSDSNTGFT